ncbi:MAG: SMC-Scp complex subunit ScpB [Nitriliruptoraceae bacterium]
MSEQPAPTAAGSRSPVPIGEPIPPAGRRPGLEAVLFLADEPVELSVLAELVDATVAETEAELEALAETYRRTGSGLEVRRAAGGWRLYTSPAGAAVARRFALQGRAGRLTPAALETLAVIAYKQPVTRQAISDIRGVNADAAVRSLVARGFVTEAGRDPGPGQPVLYATTTLLLERLGLDSLEQLPPLTDHLPEAPAPDEPALERLKEVRRRLAAGEDLPGPAGRSAGVGETGPRPEAAEEPDDDEDAMPPPTSTRGPAAAADMEELSGKLEAAARSALGRLRAAVAAEEPPSGEHDDESDDPPPDGGDDPTEEPAEEPTDG